MAGFFDDVAASVGKSAARSTKKAAPKKRAPARKTPRASTARKPSGGGLLGNAQAAVEGAVSGGSRAAAQGKTRAQAGRSVERDTQRLRRTDAIRDYLDAPRAERSKQAAAAQRRVNTGKGSEHDKLIVETHARRTRNDEDRPRAAVQAANEAHDRAARKAQAVSLIAGLGKASRGDVGTEHRGLLSKLEDDFKSLPSDFVKGTKENTGSVLSGAGSAVSAVGDARASAMHRTADPLQKAQYRAGAGDDAVVAVARTAGNTLKAASEDPVGVTAKTAKGLLESVPETVAAIPQLLMHPGESAKGIAKDYSDRYGWAMEPDKDRREEGAKKQRERIKKEGAAAEVLDAAIVGPTASTAGARAVSRIGRTGQAGTRRAAMADFVDAPRPDLAIGDGKAVAQRKSSGLLGITAQRALDKKRETRVQKQAEAKRSKAQFGDGTPTDTRAARERANQRSRQDHGRGVRGVLPRDGQVAHLSAGWAGPFDRQAAAQRKQLSKLTGTASRRVNRAADDHARPAEVALAKLRPEERRAARAALEGRLSLTDPKVALAQVDRQIASVKREREALKAKPKKAADYEGLIAEQTDNLRSLTQLRRDLADRPGKVLTPALREFVKTEQARRPEFEDVAGDVLTPVTMERRRVDPAAVDFGTYEQHATERKALDALRAADGDVQKAVASIDAKRDRASVTSEKGKAKRRTLGRDKRALEEITRGAGPRLSASDIDELEAKLVDAHYDRTAQAATAAGVENFDPVFFGHRRADSGGLSEFTAGAGGKGKVAGFKRSELQLHKLGFVDETPGGYAIGKQQAAKRAAQWQLVDEVAQDFVPKWARGADGNGITRKQFESEVRKQGLDPQDWALWQSKASLDDNGRGNTGDGDLGLTLDDVNRLGSAAPAWTRGRFHVIPRNVLDDMNQQAGKIARTAQRVAGGTSGAILGSNPFYAIRQTLQTVPLTLVHTKLGILDPVVRANFRALRKAEKNNPRVMRDLHDRFGTRSRMKDFTESPRMGSLARDEKRWAAGLAYDQRILFGVDWNHLVEERRSPGARGTASLIARTAAKRNPLSVVLRASRDFNVLVDGWQDRLQRTFVLAYEDARLAKQGIRKDFPQIASQDAGDLARKLGPIAAASQLPWSEYKALDRSPEFRHTVEDAGDQLVKFLGDYANYSKAEQRYARSVFMFYGFVRHSGRLLLTTLPLEHPVMFAAALQLGQLSAQERSRMIDQFAKRHLLTPETARGVVAIADGDTLKTIDTKWMNPLLGPLTEIGSSGITGQLPIPTPYVAFLESRFGVSDFSGNPLSNEHGPAIYGNKLSAEDRGRVFANRMLSMLYPVRVLDTALNGDRGKMADTSIPLIAPQPVKYKAGGEGDEKNKHRIAEATAAGGLLRAAEAGVPLFPKRGSKLIESAEYTTDNAPGVPKPKKKPRKKKPATTGSFGGAGGFGGGGGFGNSGGGF